MSISFFSGPRLDFTRRVLRQRVIEIFNDISKGERPVVRRDSAMFAPESVVWRVHGDVVTMLIGGFASLMLQMLHPRVLAGVWDHSGFREDMYGRLRGTARFISTTTYADKREARTLIEKVNAIHAKVKGVLPDGRIYSALEPDLLAWVHVTETWSFLNAWIRYGEPGMTALDRDTYFAEMAQIGHALGADPIPKTLAEAECLISDMRPQLKADKRSHEVARLVLQLKMGGLSTAAASKILMAAGIDLSPEWARRMHDFSELGVKGPAVRLSALAIARIVRWAFEGSRDHAVVPLDHF